MAPTVTVPPVLSLPDVAPTRHATGPGDGRSEHGECGHYPHDRSHGPTPIAWVASFHPLSVSSMVDTKYSKSTWPAGPATGRPVWTETTTSASWPHAETVASWEEIESTVGVEKRIVPREISPAALIPSNSDLVRSIWGDTVVALRSGSSGSDERAADSKAIWAENHAVITCWEVPASPETWPDECPRKREGGWEPR